MMATLDPESEHGPPLTCSQSHQLFRLYSCRPPSSSRSGQSTRRLFPNPPNLALPQSCISCVCHPPQTPLPYPKAVSIVPIDFPKLYPNMSYDADPMTHRHTRKRRQAYLYSQQSRRRGSHQVRTPRTLLAGRSIFKVCFWFLILSIIPSQSFRMDYSE